jgi:tetratricopeptide (TPR) repeat protein
MLKLTLLGCSLVFAVLAKAQPQAAPDAQAGSLDEQFKAAIAAYDAGRFSEAAAKLQAILPSAPGSFEVREMLGLAQAARSLNEQAVEQLQIAVSLKPNSAAARTNLATSLAQSGRIAEACDQGRSALALEPHNYEANHNLAELYIQMNKISEAIPLLEQAQRSRPNAYGNGYDLALAYLLTGKLDQSRQTVNILVQQRDTGELHNLLGRIDEKQGRFIEAANEFASASHLDPSEDNLFVWASELLLHRTYQPAIDVFRQATMRYPDSPRLLIGLGMALYSRGEYEESIRTLLKATDADPTDARGYLFLSKAYLSSPNQAQDVIDRFRRYAELEPANALAQYYYAVSLWKGKRIESSSIDYAAVESLLQKAIALDGTLAAAHLQLGILYNDQHAYAKSLPEYERALQLDPSLADAHYRLGQYYVHAGDKAKAQGEFDLYQKLQAQHQALVDKERAEVQQFVVSAKPAPAARP